MRRKQQVADLLDKRLKDQGHSTSERKTGGALVGTLTSDVAYEPVTGIGDAAAWSVDDSRLVVLKGRTTFKVEAHVSGDKATNLTLARKLAGEVLAKCR